MSRATGSRALGAFLLLAIVCLVGGISVPTGKQTPITPARVAAPGGGVAAAPRISRAPAPVFEYTEENPEPPLLHPSYAPENIKYLNALTPNAIYYVPLRLRVPDYRNPGSFDRPKYNMKVLQYRVHSRNNDQPQHDAYAKVDPTALKSMAGDDKAALNKQYVFSSTRRPTKSGYPKKATAYPDYTKYYHYLHSQHRHHQQH